MNVCQSILRYDGTDVGGESKRRQTETATVKTATEPKRRQTITTTNRNGDSQNGDRAETATNHNGDFHFFSFFVRSCGTAELEKMYSHKTYGQ